MNPIKQFYEATVDLIELLEQASEENRDERIEKIEELLDKRDRSLQSIQPPFSQGEEMLVKKALALNEKVMELFQREKTAIEKDINQLKKRRKTNQKYVNPYASLRSVEGAYYDKKN